jgi:hypothetical protein
MENIWTKVLVETSNYKGETWKKDTRFSIKPCKNLAGFQNTTQKKPRYNSGFCSDNKGFDKVENTGFEPVASCLPGKRSSQLS